MNKHSHIVTRANDKVQPPARLVFEGQSPLEMGESRNEICTQMIQEWCCTKTYEKENNILQSSKRRGISRKRKGNWGAEWLVGWLVNGGQTATCACSAFAFRPRLANNKAARLTTTTSVRSLPFLHPFIISPFSFSFSFPALPSYYSASSIMFAFRVPIYGPAGHRPTNALCTPPPSPMCTLQGGQARV